MWNKTALSSHIISALTDVCDEVSYIHKGKKLQIIPMKQLNILRKKYQNYT